MVQQIFLYANFQPQVKLQFCYLSSIVSSNRSWSHHIMRTLQGQVKLGQRTCTCRLRQIQYQEIKLTYCTTSLERKINRGHRKEKEEDVGKEKWEAENLHRPNKTKRGGRDYTDESLALFNHRKPLMNLWRALVSALDTELKLRTPQTSVEIVSYSKTYYLFT